METYVSLTLNATGEKLEKLNEVLDLMGEYNLDACRDFFNEVDPELASLLNKIEETHGEYIEGIENITKSSGSVVANWVCGSGGLDFAADLVRLFGRCADSVRADYDHDEEHDEDEEDFILTYENGKVMLHGQEFTGDMY